MILFYFCCNAQTFTVTHQNPQTPWDVTKLHKTLTVQKK